MSPNGGCATYPHDGARAYAPPPGGGKISILFSWRTIGFLSRVRWHQPPSALLSRIHIFFVEKPALTRHVTAMYHSAMTQHREMTKFAMVISRVDRALHRFEEQTGMVPKVVVLPSTMYDQFILEHDVIASAMPYEPGCDKDEWLVGDAVEVRVVEHESSETIEVY